MEVKNDTQNGKKGSAEDPAQEIFELEASVLNLNTRKATLDKDIKQLEAEEKELKELLKK